MKRWFGLFCLSIVIGGCGLDPSSAVVVTGQRQSGTETTERVSTPKPGPASDSTTTTIAVTATANTRSTTAPTTTTTSTTTTTTNAVAPSTTDAVDDIAAALLTAEELGDQWNFADESPYDSRVKVTTDYECDALVASDLMDLSLLYEVEIAHAGGANGLQYIGETTSPDVASNLVARFAALPSCPDSVALGALTGGAIEIDHATAGAYIQAPNSGDETTSE